MIILNTFFLPSLWLLEKRIVHFPRRLQRTTKFSLKDSGNRLDSKRSLICIRATFPLRNLFAEVKE